MNANIKYQVIKVNENNEVINRYGINEIYNCRNKREVKKILKTSNFGAFANNYYKTVNVKTNKLVKRFTDKRIFINNMLTPSFEYLEVR